MGLNREAEPKTLKIPAGPPPLGGISAMLRQARRESPKCKEVFYCNSLANPAASCGECARCAFSRDKTLHPARLPMLMSVSFLKATTTDVANSGRKVKLRNHQSSISRTKEQAPFEPGLIRPPKFYHSRGSKISLTLFPHGYNE